MKQSSLHTSIIIGPCLHAIDVLRFVARFIGQGKACSLEIAQESQQHAIFKQRRTPTRLSGLGPSMRTGARVFNTLSSEFLTTDST